MPNPKIARRLARSLEPFAGQVYFSPECHAAYQALGFPGKPTTLNGVQRPDMVAYFASRGAILGDVPGHVVASAFGVFKTQGVVDAIEVARATSTPAQLMSARTSGAGGQLRRILGLKPEGIERAVELLERSNADLDVAGKPLFAGLLADATPDDPLLRAWRLADQVREYRGDAHTAAWTIEGLTACEIGMLTELYWGMASRSYVRSRLFSDADLDVAERSLAAKGLIADAALTTDGRSLREAIEAATDNTCEPMVAALGNSADELITILSGWSAHVCAQLGYPSQGPRAIADASKQP